MVWKAERQLPKDWPNRRRAVLERDGYRCRLCGLYAPGNPARSSTDRRGVLEVDHVGDRDDHSLGNLRALCFRCHGKRTARQGNAARPTRARPVEPHPGKVSQQGLDR